VTSLVTAMARSDGVRAGSGGNLGPPALTLLGRGHELYVLELSSFQLETTGALRPVAATVLNISADHMDRYENLDAYVAAKSRALGGDTVVITNLDDPLAAMLAGLGLGEAMGLRVRAMVGAVEGFTGLPNRCGMVAVHRGVRWINDSKGTNVGAAVAAIEGIGAQGPVVLIAGGTGKGADFAPLGEPAGRHVRCAVLIGRDAPGLAAALGGSTEVRYARDLSDAVDIAATVAGAGDSVLFSPACASFDMFADFEARGDAFRRLVPGRSAR